LFATQSRDFLLEKDTQHTNTKKRNNFCFLVLVIKSMSAVISEVSRRNQACLISRSISCVALQSLHSWESTFAYYERREHIFSKKSLKRSNCPFALWSWAWLPFNYFKVASL